VGQESTSDYDLRQHIRSQRIRYVEWSIKHPNQGFWQERIAVAVVCSTRIDGGAGQAFRLREGIQHAFQSDQPICSHPKIVGINARSVCSRT
jgi:hypothetical protein